MEREYLDSLIINAFEKDKEVVLFLCKDKEGGFGVKVDGKEVAVNLPWEVFEIEIDDANPILNEEKGVKGQ